MKKILLSVVVIGALSLSFTGCKKDDVEKSGGYVAEIMSENLLSNVDISIDYLELDKKSGKYHSVIEAAKEEGVVVNFNLIFCQDKKGIWTTSEYLEGETNNESNYFEWEIINKEINLKFSGSDTFDTLIDEDGNNKLDENNIYKIKDGENNEIMEGMKLKLLKLSPTTLSCDEPL